MMKKITFIECLVHDTKLSNLSHLQNGGEEILPCTLYGGEEIKPGTLHGGEEIKPGTLHGGEEIKPGTLHGGEEIKPGTLYGGEEIKPGTLHGDKEIKPGMLHGGEEIKPGTLHGGEEIKPGTLHGGEEIKPGTLHGGEEIKPGTLHGGEDIKPGTLHSGEEIKPGTLHGGEEIKPGTLHAKEKRRAASPSFSLEQLKKGTLHADISPATYRTKDGGAYYKFRYVSTGGKFEIDIVEQPSYRHRDTSAHVVHRLPSARGGEKICISAGHEPTTLARAKSISMQWAELTHIYINTGRTLDQQISQGTHNNDKSGGFWEWLFG
jgi:hypothetical protein